MPQTPIKVEVNPKGFDFDAAPTIVSENPTELLTEQLTKLEKGDVVRVARSSTGTALRVKAAIKRAATRVAGAEFELKRPDHDHWAVRRAA